MWRHAQHLDRRLMKRSFRARSHALDQPLVAITQAANYSRLWLLVAGVLAVFKGRQGQTAAARGLVAIAIAAAVANGPAKLLVRRRRPFSRSRPTLIRMPRSTSFPSGHTAAAFAFATAAGTKLPASAPALVPLAGAVAYSRVHTGVHYPSDVAAGAAVGIISGLLAARLPCRVNARRRHHFSSISSSRSSVSTSSSTLSCS
jgi:membrane-associated phospholipid phosphatase